MENDIYLDTIFKNISLKKSNLISSMLNDLCKKVYLGQGVETLVYNGEYKIEKGVLGNKFELLFLRSGDLVILLNYISKDNEEEINTGNYKQYLIPYIGLMMSCHVKKIKILGKVYNTINCYNAFIPYVKKMQNKKGDEKAQLDVGYNESFFEGFETSLRFGDFGHEYVREENNKLIFSKMENIDGRQYQAYEYIPMKSEGYMGEDPHIGTGYRFEYLTCDNIAIITNYEKL